MLKIVFFLVMFATVTVSAEDTPVTTEPEAGQAEAIEEKPAKQGTDDKAPETFDPTEEISEDYSIEFPVDI